MKWLKKLLSKLFGCKQCEQCNRKIDTKPLSESKIYVDGKVLKVATKKEVKKTTSKPKKKVAKKTTKKAKK